MRAVQILYIKTAKKAESSCVFHGFALRPKLNHTKCSPSLSLLFNSLDWNVSVSVRCPRVVIWISFPLQQSTPVRMPCGSASNIKLVLWGSISAFCGEAPSRYYAELSIWVIPFHSAHDAVWMFDVELQQGPGLHSKLPSPNAFLKHVCH